MGVGGAAYARQTGQEKTQKQDFREPSLHILIIEQNLKKLSNDSPSNKFCGLPITQMVMAIIVKGFSPWLSPGTGQSVSGRLCISEQAGRVLTKNWVIPTGLPQTLTHGKSHPASGIERFGPLQIPIKTGGIPGFPLPGSPSSASVVTYAGGIVEGPAKIPLHDRSSDSEGLSAMEDTRPPGGRGKRTYIGWDQSGYDVTGKQDDRNTKRGRDETSVSVHELTFTLTNRSGKQFSFVITDALSLRDESVIFSIHGRQVRVTAVPPGMELFGTGNDRTVADYAEDEVFIAPNLNHVCAIHLRGTETDYPGLEMTLLIGCVNRNGLKRSYLHKKLVGLRIRGVNPRTGMPWKNEFNSHLLRAEMRPEGSFRVEGGSIRVGGVWGDDGFTLDDETTDEGYALAEDPLGRADHALIMTPDSRGGGLVIHVPSDQEGSRPIVLRSVPAERLFSVWQFKLGLRQHPLSVRREGDEVTISFGGGNVHRYSETIYLLEAPKKAGLASPYFLLVIQDGADPLLFELDVAHYMAYRYVQTPELTETQGVAVTHFHQTDGRYDLEFVDREMNVRFSLNGIVIPEEGEGVNLSGIKGLAIDLGGAGDGSEPIEIFHDGQAIIVPGFARYEIDVVRNGGDTRLNIHRSLIDETEGEGWVRIESGEFVRVQ